MFTKPQFSVCAASLCSIVVVAACGGGHGITQDVSVTQDLSNPMAAPFPADKFTVADAAQVTGLRVSMPSPNCTTNPNDCNDISILNQLDGFSLHPTAYVPFNGAIDPTTATASNVFFVELADQVTGQSTMRQIGIDQAIWNPAKQILSAKPNVHLHEHTRYALLITSGVKDARGNPISSPAFQAFLSSSSNDPYQNEVSAAYAQLKAKYTNIVSMSVFTTESITPDFSQIRAQMAAMPTPTADFNVATVNGSITKAVFDTSTITGAVYNFQNAVSPSAKFQPDVLNVSQLSLVPGSASRIVFGQFSSPNYLTADRLIPTVPSKTGTIQVQGSNQIGFVLYLPSGTMPANGWPVAIWGHGYQDTNVESSWGLSSVLPSQGIAVIAINAVGHGGGPLTHFDLTTSNGTTTSVLTGGRTVALPDLPGTANGSLTRYEGVNAYNTNSLIDIRDGIRQTVVDLMQLTRLISGGVDVDGSGHNTLDPTKIYYVGASMGGVYGTVFVANEPKIKAAELYVTGGPWPDIVRLGSIKTRSDMGYSLMFAARTPSLSNKPGTTFPTYNENIPTKYSPPMTDTVAGAFELQQWFDRNEWAGQKANPIVYAPFITTQPMFGAAPRPIALMIANGDQTMNNQVSDVLAHAGGFRSHVSMFRYDLLKQATPSLPADPHRWQTGAVAGTQAQQIQSQQQVATFLQSNGATFLDPDGSAPIFEAPAVSLPFDNAVRD